MTAIAHPMIVALHYPHRLTRTAEMTKTASDQNNRKNDPSSSHLEHILQSSASLEMFLAL